MSDELRALPRDTPDYHARQAAHLRALAETARSARLKTRLLKEAEQHESLAVTEQLIAGTTATASMMLDFNQDQHAKAPCRGAFSSGLSTDFGGNRIGSELPLPSD